MKWLVFSSFIFSCLIFANPGDKAFQFPVNERYGFEFELEKTYGKFFFITKNVNQKMMRVEFKLTINIDSFGTTQTKKRSFVVETGKNNIHKGIMDAFEGSVDTDINQIWKNLILPSAKRSKGLLNKAYQMPNKKGFYRFKKNLAVDD